MKNIQSLIPAAQRRLLKKTAFPKWISPMLATLTKDYFSDPNWIFEEKFDGIRILAFCNGSKVSLLTRNKKSANDRYPEIAHALQKQKLHCVLDGEVVAYGKKKITHFELLQQRLMAINLDEALQSKIKIYYCIFDIMYLDGYDVTKLPLLERKKLLKAMLPKTGILLYTPHKVKNGEAYRKAACKKGWEGIMAKRADSTYQHKRSRDWLKFKCINEQELVIAGYTEPQGSRTAFGALLLGYYEKGVLKFAGKVGTGFDETTLQSLYAKLSKLERKKCPFAHDDQLPKSKVHWVAPQLVAQIGFEEWTSSNKLRQPRYLGLRPDKKAKEVVKEVPK